MDQSSVQSGSAGKRRKDGTDGGAEDERAPYQGVVKLACPGEITRRQEDS